MKKRARLQKKLTVRTLSFIMASMLLLLVIPFAAIAAGKENPEPGKKGDFRLFSNFYSASKVTLEAEQTAPIVVSAELGSNEKAVKGYQWQAYSLGQERYVNMAGQTGKEIRITGNLVSGYNYGNGESYLRCQAVVSDSDMQQTLTSDVLTVVLHKEQNDDETQSSQPADTVQTIDLFDPTQPGDTEETQPATEPTQAEVTDSTTEPTQVGETEPTTSPTEAENSEVEKDEPTNDDSEPLTGKLLEPMESEDAQSDLPPLRGMLLAPMLREASTVDITFDLDGGTGVDNLTGLTSGESQIIDTPRREGYIFTGWQITSPEDLDADVQTELENAADNGNLTVPEYSVSLKATWKRDATISDTTHYTILYWLQNAEDNDYSVYDSVSVTGVEVGSRQSVASSNLVFPDSDIRSYVSTYLPRSETGEKTINADGSTVFNLYYDRKTYTITFNANKPVTLGTVSDPVFNRSLTFDARYGQKIDTLWPDRTWVQTNPVSEIKIFGITISTTTYYFEGVTVGSTVYRNKPVYLTKEILQHGTSFDLEWTSSSTEYTVSYRFQTVEQAKNNNTTYAQFVSRAEYPNQTVYGSSTFQNIAIEGFNYANQSSSTNPRYRYYKRTPLTLTYANTDLEVEENHYYEETLSEPSISVPEGYTLEWYTDPDFQNKITDWSAISMPAHNLTVYAKWTKQPGSISTVTVYKYKDDSNQLQENIATITTPTGNPAKPDAAVQNRSRDRYRFIGWYYDDNGTEKEFVFNSTVVNSDMTVYGKWTANNVTVTVYKTQVDMNNGSPVLTTITTTPGAAAAADSAVTDVSLEGHTLSGWKTENGSDFTFGSSAVNSNIKVYGVWTPISYNLTIHFNNGTADTTEPVAYGTAIMSQPSDPVWEGHTFTGWSFDDDAVTWGSNMPAKDVVVTAQWTINKYTVEFYYSPGLISTENLYTATNVVYGTHIQSGLECNFGVDNKLDVLKDQDTVMKAFDGWYYDADSPDNPSSSPVNEQTFQFGDSGTPITSNMKVYAKWVPKYNVNFYSKEVSGTLIQTYPVREGGTLDETPASPTEDGWAFETWYYNAGTVEEPDPQPFTSAVIVEKDIDVYATWKEKVISIAITNGGQNANIFEITKQDGSQDSGSVVLTVAVQPGAANKVTVVRLPYTDENTRYRVSVRSRLGKNWDFRHFYSDDILVNEEHNGVLEAEQSYEVTFGEGTSRSLNWLGGQTFIG